MSTTKIVALMGVGAVFLAAAIVVGLRLGSPEPDPRKMVEALVQGAATELQGGHAAVEKEKADSAELQATQDAVQKGVRLVQKFHDSFGAWPRDQSDFLSRAGWAMPTDGLGKPTFLRLSKGDFFLVCGTVPKADFPKPGDFFVCSPPDESLAWVDRTALDSM